MLDLLLLFAIIAYNVYTRILPPARIPAQRRAVVISGCDTGFGHTLATSLYTRNYTVYAGCYTDKGRDELQSKIPNAHVFKLDVTQQSDVDNAVKLVQQHSNGELYALVNNAGIGNNGLIDWVDIQHYQKMMDTNFFGHVRMTKAFLPLLITRQHSRVINMASIAGILAVSGLTGYCASKYALEAFSDGLRREMYPFKMHVSVVEPGYLRTAILDGVNPSNDQNQKAWDSIAPDVKSRWGDAYRGEVLKAGGSIARFAEGPELVNTAYLDAISSSRPKHRYRVGRWATFLFYPAATFLPTFVSDWMLRVVDGFKEKPTWTTTHQKPLET